MGDKVYLLVRDESTAWEYDEEILGAVATAAGAQELAERLAEERGHNVDVRVWRGTDMLAVYEHITPKQYTERVGWYRCIDVAPWRVRSKGPIAEEEGSNV